jgi:hypothetical protein
MTAPDLRTAAREADDLAQRLDDTPAGGRASLAMGDAATWLRATAGILRTAALTAEATEPPADPGGFVAEILADYGDDLTNADDRVEAINRIASALTPGPAPDPQGADDRCRVSENGSVSHRWACDFGPDCPAPGGVMRDPQGDDEPHGPPRQVARLYDPANPDRVVVLGAPHEPTDDESPPPESCEECDGEGVVDCDDPDCDTDSHECPSCGGFGR